MPEFPGNAVASSMMAPVFTTWWLRPVRSAMRVGEQRAVVWYWLNFRPAAARESITGIGIGPPKALGWPKPMSSIRMITTFGAPAGAVTRKGGGGVASRTSSVV